MAELSALANILSVIGAGIKLSTVLYEFASSIGSAGRDIRRLAGDVSLFCAVLKQVQSVLSKAKGFRVSMTAIDSTQEVLDRCQSVFDDLGQVIEKLKGNNDEVSLISRVKWTLQKPKVQVLLESLRACTAYLHLMVTTLTLAERLSAEREPMMENPDDAEQTRALTNSLFLTQQSNNEELERLERQADEEQNAEEAFEPQKIPGVSQNRDHRHSMLMQGGLDESFRKTTLAEAKRTSLLINEAILGGLSADRYSRISVLSASGPGSTLLTDTLLQKWTDQRDRMQEPALVPLASAEVQLYGPSHSISRPIGRLTANAFLTEAQPILFTRHGRIQSPAKAGKMGPLFGDDLRRPSVDVISCAFEFSDHAKPASALNLYVYTYHGICNGEAPLLCQDLPIKTFLEALQACEGTAHHFPLFRIEPKNQDLMTPADNEATRRVQGSINHTVQSRYQFAEDMAREVQTDLSSFTEKMASAVSSPTSDRKSEGASASVEMFKSFRIGYDDRCCSVLPAALRKYNIHADWRHYSLYIVYGDQERCVGLQEKPLGLFKDLDREGKRPMFMLRKLVHPLLSAVVDQGMPAGDV